MDENPDDTIDIVENKLRELRAQINKMKDDNAAMFERMGLSPDQLDDYLSDSNRHTPQTFAFIEKKRQALEAIIERRLSEIQASVEQTDKQLPPPNIRGHWIFVR